MSSSHGEENKQCLNSYPKGDEEGEGEGEEGKEKEKKNYHIIAKQLYFEFEHSVGSRKSHFLCFYFVTVEILWFQTKVNYCIYVPVFSLHYFSYILFC